MRPFRSLPLACALAWAATAPAQAADATFYFSATTPYLSAADIPAGFYDSGVPDFLEDFEDNALGGGLSADRGAIIGPGAFTGSRDGVDGDDGVIDGTCGPQGTKCHDWFYGGGSTGVTFTYAGATLPTAFGVVWTDGGGAVTFTAYDGNGAVIGSITPAAFADGGSGGGTAEDRFFGVTYADGIGAIKIRNSSGGIEVDHLQYGAMTAAVPEPPVWAMLAAGGLLAGLRRRRQAPR